MFRRRAFNDVMCFFPAGGGGGYNFNFPLNLPQPLLLVCLVFRRGDAGRGGLVVGEVGRNREQNV